MLGPSMLDQSIKQQLSGLLGQIPGNVTLQLTLTDSEASRQLQDLVLELVALSDKLQLSPEPGLAVRAPALTISSTAGGTSIGFAGVPSGHEFTSLVLALLHSGGYPLKLEPAQQEQIIALDGDYHFEVYISLSCQTCPDVVQALNMMAALNPRVRTVMIDGAVFQNEIEQRNVLAVPTVYLNGKRFSQGRINITDILRKLDDEPGNLGKAAPDSKASHEMLKASNKMLKVPYDMLVVGGGPAGASAAIYAARKGLRTGIVAEHFGGQVLDTVGIENFISVKATEGPRLVASLEEHVRDYAVDIMQSQRAREITARDSKGLFHVHLESGATLHARSIILATGARWKQIDVPGESEYKGSGVAYCPHCDGPLFKDKKVAVIGGGNSGVEAAIDLAGIVEHVTLLEFGSTLKADQVLIDKARSLRNLTIINDAQTTAIDGDGARVRQLRYKNRNSGEEHSVELAGVFVQIGLVPNSDPVKGLVELNRFGEVLVNRKGETSVPGIFAAGDVSDVAFKQIIIAMGSGASAALGAFEYLIRSSPQVQNEKAA